jgi:hypothetical protein
MHIIVVIITLISNCCEDIRVNFSFCITHVSFQREISNVIIDSLKKTFQDSFCCKK